jgi:hypothetical protein
MEPRLLYAIEVRCRRHGDALRQEIREALERAKDAEEDEP